MSAMPFATGMAWQDMLARRAGLLGRAKVATPLPPPSMGNGHDQAAPKAACALKHKFMISNTLWSAEAQDVHMCVACMPMRYRGTKVVRSTQGYTCAVDSGEAVGAENGRGG